MLSKTGTKGSVTASRAKSHEKNDLALFRRIDDRGRDAGHPAPPAQIRTRATNAYGSSLGSITKKRSSSYGDWPV